jgi:hypothetical protein
MWISIPLFWAITQRVVVLSYRRFGTTCPSPRQGTRMDSWPLMTGHRWQYCACAMLSSVACPALQYFCILSHKQHDFSEKGYWTQNACFDILYDFCLTFLILRRTERDTIKHAYWSSYKVLAVRSYETWIFLTDFRKIPKYKTLC